MNEAAIPATAASATMKTMPVGEPAARHAVRAGASSTAGLSASARKSAIRSQLSDVARDPEHVEHDPDARRIPSTAKIVRGRKWTMRSIPTRKFRFAPASSCKTSMSLRAPRRADATLPDGRVVHVRVGVPRTRTSRHELDTVTIELSRRRASCRDQHRARRRPGARRSRSHGDRRRPRVGTLAPTAGALEPLADSSADVQRHAPHEPRRRSRSSSSTTTRRRPSRTSRSSRATGSTTASSSTASSPTS